MTNCQRIEAANIMQRDGFAAAVAWLRSATKASFCLANEFVNDILENGV